jgi:hypothetical protein
MSSHPSRVERGSCSLLRFVESAASSASAPARLGYRFNLPRSVALSCILHASSFRLFIAPTRSMLHMGTLVAKRGVRGSVPVRRHEDLSGVLFGCIGYVCRGAASYPQLMSEGLRNNMKRKSEPNLRNAKANSTHPMICT